MESSMNQHSMSQTYLGMDDPTDFFIDSTPLVTNILEVDFPVSYFQKAIEKMLVLFA